MPPRTSSAEAGSRSGAQQRVEASAYDEQADRTHRQQVDHRDPGLPGDDPRGQLAAEHDTAVERGRLDDPPQDSVERRDREERAREQEQGQLDQRDLVEVLPGVHVGRQPHADGTEGEPDQQRGGEREHRPPRVHQPERPHHQQERHGVRRAPELTPDDLAAGDVGGGQRRDQHLVVELLVLQLEEDVEGRVEQGAVERGRREHPGRDELGVGDRVAVELEGVDELPDADADGEQVEDRLQEAGDEQLPLALGRRVVAQDDKAAALQRPQGRVGGRRARAAPRRHLVTHRASLRARVRSATYQPTTSTATRTIVLIAAVDRSTVSRQSIRVRLTPCHSGVSLATTSPTVPRLLIGKNEPEKRNRGTSPSRKIRPNDASLRTWALNANVQAAKAIPVSIVANHARIGPHHDPKTPKGAINTKYTPVVAPTRNRVNTKKALARSRDSSGVASWA